MQRLVQCAVFVTGCLFFGGLAAGADRPADLKITEWVREALASDPRIVADGVDVYTEAGIVTLRGSVPTLAGKRYGILSAQKIRGVLGVVDQVDVEAPTRPDREIARDVERRIRRSRAITPSDLEVSSTEATVALKGRVASWSQRLQAEVLATEVRGVRAVDNQLVSEVATKRPDPEIQGDVEAALQRDVYLVGLPIRVVVEDGVVGLMGSVSAPYEKTRAGTEAGWVANVRSVDNKIEVEWWPDRSTRVRPPEVPTDAELAASVRDELGQDDRIDAGEIDVSASLGHIKLKGTVPSQRQRRLAEEDARNVVGVTHMNSELRVTFSPRPDGELRGEIEEAFARDSALFENEISVSVQDGVVTLEGDVGSGYHRAHAAAIASRTRGVGNVVNRLRTMAVVVAADDALAGEIERRIERDWRTGPMAARIHVEVEEGVVTLSGSVDRLAERRAAGRIARRTPGVRRVKNEVSVEPYPYPWDEHPEDDERPMPDWDPHWDFPDLPWVAQGGLGVDLSNALPNAWRGASTTHGSPDESHPRAAS